MPDSFKDDGEIRSLVNAFENCEIHPAEFKHYQHLAVALWYLTRAPYAEAGEEMRRGIQRLAAAYGKTGYHETITVFWLRLVWDFLSKAAPEESVSALANRLALFSKEVIYDYYSAELLNSAQAKEGWVEPDLKPLPLVMESLTRKPASRPACAESPGKS